MGGPREKAFGRQGYGCGEGSGRNRGGALTPPPRRSCALRDSNPDYEIKSLAV